MEKNDFFKLTSQPGSVTLLTVYKVNSCCPMTLRWMILVFTIRNILKVRSSGGVAEYLVYVHVKDGRGGNCGDVECAKLKKKSTYN